MDTRRRGSLPHARATPRATASGAGSTSTCRRSRGRASGAIGSSRAIARSSSGSRAGCGSARRSARNALTAWFFLRLLGLVLRRRLCLARSPDHRTGRRPRHPTGRRLPAAGARARSDRSAACGSRRACCGSPTATECCARCAAWDSPHLSLLAIGIAPLLGALVAWIVLPVARDGLPRLPVVPVGRVCCSRRASSRCS